MSPEQQDDCQIQGQQHFTVGENHQGKAGTGASLAADHCKCSNFKKYDMCPMGIRKS